MCVWTIPHTSAAVPGNLNRGEPGLVCALSTHRAKVCQPLSHLMSVPTTVHKPMLRPVTCALLCCVQGQGALSERLRSFSMQDLTTIRGDGAPAPSGPPPPGTGRSSGKHGQPKMSRSASESAGSSGRSLRFPFVLLSTTINSSSTGCHSGCPLPHRPTETFARVHWATRHHVGHSGSWPGDCAWVRLGLSHSFIIV